LGHTSTACKYVPSRICKIGAVYRMEIPNIFSKQGLRPDRKKKIGEIRSNRYLNPSNDFMEYGYDYFDNADIHSGYRYYTYDGSFEKPVSDLISAFHLSAGMKVADYGCAKGYLLYEFHRQDFPVIGFERSEYAIQKAHPEVKDEIVRCNDPRMISEHEFDFLISRNVIPHLDRDAIAALITEAINTCSKKPYFVIHSFESDKNRDNYEYWDRTHVTVMNADQWRQFLEPFNEEILFSFDLLF
jgi:cyclopropane fatty-acyl-phospholipid synthase-like methyltransferase